MLDLGFLPQVRQILRRVPAERQTMMFSATMPPAIEELARTMLRDPERIDIIPEGARRDGPQPPALRRQRRQQAPLPPGAAARGARLDARLRPAEDRRRVDLPHPSQRGTPGGAHPLRPLPGAARGGARELPRRAAPHPRRHRHRGARHRRPGHHSHDQLRHARDGGGVRPSRGPHRARRRTRASCRRSPPGRTPDGHARSRTRSAQTIPRCTVPGVAPYVEPKPRVSLGGRRRTLKVKRR